MAGCLDREKKGEGVWSLDNDKMGPEQLRKTKTSDLPKLAAPEIHVPSPLYLSDATHYLPFRYPMRIDGLTRLDGEVKLVPYRLT